MLNLDSLKNLRNSHRKDFRHCFLPDKGAYNDDTPTGRYYVTTEGNRYRSVTGFLKAVKGESEWLDRWVEKQGGVEAAKIETDRRKDRGTGVHAAIEHLLINDPKPELADPYRNMYYQLETMLRLHVDDIYAIELALYSHVLKLGGRVDAIGCYKGELSILDWKTSSIMKKADWITDYFLQATCYSLMAEEMYGIRAKQLVIAVALEDNPKPQIFIRQRSEFTFLLSEKVKEYRRILELEEKTKESSLFDLFS